MTISLASLSGCGEFKSDVVAEGGGPEIAVIDLDEIARQLGHDEVMSRSVAEQANSLNSQLLQIRQSVASQLTEQMKQLNESANANEAADSTLQVAILKLQREAGLKLKQVQQQAEQALKQHRIKLIQDFRAETKVVANAIAKETEIGLIVTNNDTVVFSYESAVDITSQVVERMKRKSGHEAAIVNEAAVKVASVPADFR